MNNKVVTFVLLFVLKLNTGLENNRQRYNSNSDFLLHEAGGGVTASKRDYVALQPSYNSDSARRDYNSQFPALGVSSSTSPHTTTKPNTIVQQATTPKSQTSSGKRDYVAPQHSSLKPEAGRVKDLINFYDSKTNSQNVPSFSSVLQNSNRNDKPSVVGQTTNPTRYGQPVTQPSRKLPSSPTAKPPSFSSIVAGSNNPSTKLTVTTVKPSTRPHSTPFKPVVSENLSTTRRTPVLPSAIVNSNKNNNQASNSVTEAELQTLSEELLRKDVNNAAKYITINYQGKTSSQSTEDKAQGPLFTITDDAWNIATIQKLVPLLDNYERDTLVNEYVTPQEKNEENAFMDAIMSTSVIRHLMSFLKDKGYVTPDPRQQRDFLKQLWFGLYSRGKGKISSSGFEHIFLSEFRNGDVLGLHNWVYFAKEELANRVNYLGYLKYVQLNDKGVVMKLHFNQQGLDKPVDTMFIGTSPELEIALYTLCFVTRADNDCKLKLGNKDVEVVTHTFRYRSKNLIGSAYPQI